jgi:hypothetical protein
MLADLAERVGAQLHRAVTVAFVDVLDLPATPSAHPLRGRRGKVSSNYPSN